MNNPIYAILELANLALNILMIAIIIRAVLSWIRPDPRNYFVQLLNRVTDPVLKPLERLIPPFGGLDITPLVAIILIQLIQSALPAIASGL